VASKKCCCVFISLHGSVFLQRVYATSIVQDRNTKYRSVSTLFIVGMFEKVRVTKQARPSYSGTQLKTLGIHTVYFSLHIIKKVTSTKMRWAGHIACNDMRNVLVQKVESEETMCE
jgi:hypothetical protein